MKHTEEQSSSLRREGFTLVAVVALGLLMAVSAMAQDYRSLSGSSSRNGRATAQPLIAVPETTWNNAGRGFLRWWDPIFQTGTELDNDAAGTSFTGTWIDPAPIGLANPNYYLTGGYISNVFADAPYRVAVTSASTAATFTNPTAGASAVYTWSLTGLIPGETYAVQPNIPVGPTNIQPDGNFAADIRFPARYYAYEVTDNTGTYQYWIDSYVEGGGFADLDGQRFEADATGTITLRLYNTIQHDNFGNSIESGDTGGDNVVYADAVRVIGTSAGGQASYTASPVVGELTNTPFLGGAIQFGQRVVSARNEQAFIGSLNKAFNVGVVTSFAYDGTVVDPGEPLRRNMVWSWPAVRPFNLDLTTQEQYEADRQAWITSAPNPAYPRYETFTQYDNLSPGTSWSGPFASATLYDHLGPDYLLAPANAVTTGNVTWTSNMPDGNYFVEVYLPNNDPATALTKNATYTITVGGQPAETVTIDQSVHNGWFRLPLQPADGFANLQSSPITVELTDIGTAQDVTDGRQVAADAVRFISDADLSINSTPVLAQAQVNDGATTQQRDVVIAARENGKIYCMDAHGDPATGAQPKVYWTYPSEDPTTDPNSALTEDGGIATNPTKFNLSSAFVENVGGTDLLYIGSENGKVYCLEMTGRGDGTTRRRWTYPDDFNPSSPLTQMTASTLGPIKGSLAFANVNGVQSVIVPASAGRLVALDAAGNAVTKTTSVLWEYTGAGPSTGEITMSPVVAFGNVYFGAPDPNTPANGIMYAVDIAASQTAGVGTALWTRAVRADGVTAFSAFRRQTPVAIPGTLLPGLAGNPDVVVFADDTNITAMNAATGGVAWEALNATTSAVVSGLSFTHMRQYNSAGTLLVDTVPTVLAATSGGELYGFYADGSLNVSGNHRNWGDAMQGRSQVASFATGGWPNPDLRSHIYIGDSDGFLYAYSSVDDTNSAPPITPGIRPGNPTANDSDPTEAALNAVIGSNDVILISPSQYRSLVNKSRTTGIPYADITSIKTNKIDRRYFEMGETLYIAVVDINDSTVPETSGYLIQPEVSTGDKTMRLGTSPVFDVTGAPVPEDGGVALIQVQLRPDSNGITAGGATVTARAVAGGNGGAKGNPVALSDPTVPPTVALDAGKQIEIANPLGIAMINGSQAGVNVKPDDPLVRGNAPMGQVGGGANLLHDMWTMDYTPTWISGSSPALPAQRLSTSLTTVEPVPHGSDAITQIKVYDRSNMVLLRGDGRSASGTKKGINGVRWRPSDLSWQIATKPSTLTSDTSDPSYNKVFDPAGDLGVVSPLNTGTNKSTWAYRNFEDYPLYYPNRSLDYPDLTRSSLTVTKDELGQVQNPVFPGGVELAPPTYASTDIDAYYNTRQGYEDGFNKTDTATPMNVRWNVPKYQPASRTDVGSVNRAGYASRQAIYVDSGSTGFDSNDVYREFVIGANVAVDETVKTSTPTVDLGSTPAGGGFNGNNTVPNGPALPWDPTSLFKPFNPAFNSGTFAQFQQFSVLNDGNTNLLNVRMAKGFGKKTALGADITRPLELFAPGQHELAWLDGSFNLVSDLDPDTAPAFRAGLTGQYAQVTLQKSRPGDVAPTRLSTNPAARSNANLGVSGGYLLDPNIFRPGDPYVGVAPPIGTPVGSYERRIYAFNDEWNDSLNANAPVLGPTNLLIGDPSIEPYTDPGIMLKFNVRETRLTNTNTTKAAPNVENVLAGNEKYAWGNQQPTAMRLSNGSLFTAWSSNRLDNGGLPNYLPVPNRTEASMDTAPVWRIYVSSLTGTSPYGLGSVGQSPMRDFNAFVPANNTLWFNQPSASQLPAPGTAAGLFLTSPGETIPSPGVESTFKFHDPAFPNSGSIDPMVDPAFGRTSIGATAMAFLGDAPVVDGSGARSTLHQLFMANLTTNANGQVTLGGYSVLPYDLKSLKSRPSVTRTILGRSQVYDVYYTSYSNGLGEIYVSRFTNSWTQPIALGVGSMFEDLSAPTAILRRYQNSSQPVTTVMFTGKLRGRQNSEAFMGRLRLNPDGTPMSGEDPWAVYQDRYEMLKYDAKSGQYQATGIQWGVLGTNLDNIELSVRGAFNGDKYRTLALGTDPTVTLNPDSKEITMDSRLGGKIVIDTQKGTVKLSGVALPKNTDLFLQYSPRLIRVSGATSKILALRLNDPNNPAAGTHEQVVVVGNSVGANYRGLSSVFDDRYIGVYVDPDAARQDQNLLQDQAYWFQIGSNAALINADPNLQVRQDRYMLISNRTSNDGSAATRPFMSTMRFGIELPAPVYTAQNGNIPAFNVQAVDPLGPNSENYYQVDPVNGRVYFPAGWEDKAVTIVYQAATSSGGPGPTYTLTGVRPSSIFESGEQAVPIEQVGNESDMMVTLDPITNTANNLRRPPLFWLFWTSTRSGVPDVFFETIAPKTAPQGPGN